jgi:hypothetical protein
MSVALNELLDMFEGEGAIIFVERLQRGPPNFHVVACGTIRDAGTQPGTPDPVVSVLVVTEHVRWIPNLFRSTVRSIAHDRSVHTVYTQSEGLAEILAEEARRLCCCECGRSLERDLI